MAMEFKNKGNEFFKKAQYEEAIAWYTKAIDADPTSEAAGAVYSNRAASYISLKKYEKAIEDADSCIKVRPDWVKGHFRKGVAQEAMGSIDDAEKNFSAALKCEPTNVDIQDRLNAIRVVIKDRNEKATPSSCKTAQEAKQLGNSLFKVGNYEGAIGYYSRAIELAKPDDPDRGTYFVNRAVAHAQTSHHKQVIADCEEALAIDASNNKALLRRAMAYEGLEKWQKALDDYKLVVSAGVNSTQATSGVQRCQRALRQSV